MMSSATVAQPLFGQLYPVPLKYFKIQLFVVTMQRPKVSDEGYGSKQEGLGGQPEGLEAS